MLINNYLKVWAFSYFVAHAGFMSGISGIEAIPGPQLPQIDFLKQLNGLNLNYYVFVLQHLGFCEISSVWMFDWTEIGFNFVLQKKTRRNMLRMMKELNHPPWWRNCLRNPSWIKRSIFFFNYVFICIVKTIGYCHGL